MPQMVLALAFLVVIGTLGAAPASRATADLEGEPLAATSAGDHFCHDFDWPRIHCFRTAQALDAGVQHWLRPRVDGPEAIREEFTASVAASGYVKIFQYGLYAGNLAYLSRDYSNLDEIGWGDKISSYIVYNSAAGEFYVNPGYGGAIDYYCCNQSVAALSSTFDNKFSAFDLN